MTDLKGRTYAHMDTLRAGDHVQVDAGFTCIKGWAFRTVYQDDHGLWIKCTEGHHYLDGQLADDDDSLIGVYRVG